MDIGGRIRTTRKSVGLSQEELARRAGMSLKGMGDIERGDIADPHYSSLKKIADGLGVPVGELVEDSPKVEAPTSSPEKEADEGRREPADVEIARKAIKDALKQVGVEVDYLKLSSDGLLALYRAASSIEEAQSIEKGLISECRALREKLPNMTFPGNPTFAYFITRFTAIKGMTEVMQREVEATTRSFGELEQQARIEEIELAYDRSTREVTEALTSVGAA